MGVKYRFPEIIMISAKSSESKHFEKAFYGWQFRVRVRASYLGLKFRENISKYIRLCVMEEESFSGWKEVPWQIYFGEFLARISRN